MRKIPPLNALRSFEVAARHKSFTLAAEELCVTQSAVSKQVAALEAYLGRALFHREHKSLTLTDAGQMCAQAVTQSFDMLESKLSLLDAKASQRLTILTDVDFARLWLFPRLPQFEQLYPEIQISLQTKNYTQPIEAGETFDIAISWGRGKWVNLLYEPLFTNEVFPVCAPDFFEDSIARPDRITGTQLIHDRSTYWWHQFSALLNMAAINPEQGRIFSQTALCLDAAVRGDGITIGDEVTTRAYLESGALVAPFKKRLPSPDSYYLLAPLPNGFAREPVRLLRSWLVEEATRHRLWFAGFWAEQAN